MIQNQEMVSNNSSGQALAHKVYTIREKEGDIETGSGEPEERVAGMRS